MKYKYSIKEGDDAEYLFTKLLQDLGYEVRNATLDENKYSHIDLFFGNNGDLKYSVDVKAQKRASRLDDEVNQTLHYLEIKGITGYDGWVYGKANYIAFEISNSFLMVKTKDLQEWIAKNVNIEVIATSAKNSYKCVYQRPNRKDLITIIKLDELKAIASKTLPKLKKVIDTGLYKYDEVMPIILDYSNGKDNYIISFKPKDKVTFELSQKSETLEEAVSLRNSFYQDLKGIIRYINV